jgi:GT2 family glycosyltransferase
MTIPRAENAGGFALVAPAPRTVPASVHAAPSFSVLIAAYNAEQTVVPAVLSVLAQTVAPLEVIVRDDGSSDRTLQLLETLGSKIHIVRGEHRGPGAARNACLALARGTHVVPFDSDDLLEPRCLEAYDAALRARPDLGIVTCDAYLESDGVIFDRYYRRVARFATGDQRRAALHQHFIFGFPAVERAALEAGGGWDEELTGGVDTDLWLRLILNGLTVGLVWEPLAVYRYRLDSVSDDRAQTLRRMVTILERASHHPSLSLAEREFVQAELVAKERGARLAELHAALRSGSKDVRERAMAVATARNLRFGPRERLAALAAIALPRTAGKLRARRDRRRGITSLKLRTRNF